MLVAIEPSKMKTKKYTAIFYDGDKKVKTIHFGSTGMSDYTIHKDDKRKERYLKRHEKNENWNVGVVIFTPKGRAGTQKTGPPRGYVKEIFEKRSSEVVDVREHKARNGDLLL